MANEAVIIELLGDKGNPVRFTCASGTAIVKGTIMELSEPRTVTANNGAADIFAGIASAEKTANDGASSIACYTKGIFDLYSGGAAITAGDLVITSGANTIKTAATWASGALVGKALETASAGEVIAVAVGVY